MKKRRITYGVKNKVAYQTIIKVGKCSMMIEFKDGSVTAIGSEPATYTTDNLMIQDSIERSELYKKGGIKRYRVIELDEEVPVEKGSSGILAENRGEDSGHGLEVSERKNLKDNVMVEVKVTCNDDAKDYLESNYKIARSRMRSRADIIAIGEGVGVRFVWEG